MKILKKVISTFVISLLGFSVHAAVKLDTDSGFKIYDDSNAARYLSVNGTFNIDSVGFFGKGKKAVNANPTYIGIDGYKKPLSFHNGAHVRRMDFSIDAGIAEDITAGIYLHWNSKERKLKLSDAYMKYSGFNNLELSIGDVGMPYSLEGESSTQGIPFMEKSMAINSFSPDAGLGVKVTTWNDYAALNASVTHNTSKATVGSDRLVIGGRVHFAPMHADNKVFHVGLTAIHQDIDQRKQRGVNSLDKLETYAQFKATPELRNKQTSVHLLDTGRLSAKNNQVYGVDVAAQNGPFLLQADYLQTRIRGNDAALVVGNKNYRFYGYSAQASYVLTGEAREYNFKSGNFGRVVPNSKDKGAWEVAARYSALNLENKDIKGGKQNDVTLALNYYLNKHVRIVTNFIRASIHPSAQVFRDFDKRHINAFGMRLQVNW